MTSNGFLRGENTEMPDLNGKGLWNRSRMVFCRDREYDRQPISLILPHLYLGAESDVTQDCLSSQGISYVLSVSRCCPQPSFLPQSQYFRIPIDDSLRDELLPWIPEALQFIDGAVSLGCSVLVHCAAGISRSPALTVAYVMYRLGMDLDDAYRFVKERRPTISPNFNFLGQLQCFQGTLTQKSYSANQNAQPVEVRDSFLQYTSASETSASTNQDTEIPVATEKCFAVRGDDGKNTSHFTDILNQDCTHSNRHGVKVPALTLNLNQEKQNFSEFFLSDQIRTLTVNQREICSSPGSVVQTSSLVKASETKPIPKPAQLQLPSANHCLTDKRKTLTLSLAPMGTQAQVQQSSSDEDLKSTDRSQGLTSGSKFSQQVETENSSCTKIRHKVFPPNSLPLPSDERQKETRRPCGEKTQASSPGVQKKEARARRTNPAAPRSRENSSSSHDPESVCRTGCTNGEIQMRSNSSSHHQEALDMHCATAEEAVEGFEGKQSPLSSLNLTVNKLFDWGGRILMGALLGPRIRIGQPALPYH
ncbi:hypothetical protein GJAV_G00217070 [Gymnothorax javanicus]|nr:hypothetical protein GJAV_G00217070 [Gymnothorax javanicus]